MNPRDLRKNQLTGDMDAPFAAPSGSSSPSGCGPRPSPRPSRSLISDGKAASPVTIMPVGSSSSMSRRASRISIPLPCEDVWPTIRSTAAPNAGSTCPALPSASPTASAVSRPKAELPELPGGLVATEAERRHHSPAAIERGERHQRRQGLLSGCRRPCRRSGSGTSRNTDRIEIMPVNLPG